MPLDALCVSAVRNELTGHIQGMKIDKVQQPERDMLVLAPLNQIAHAVDHAPPRTAYA